ncbi:GntR family transcriptional regulator [Roseomonas sp. JC162]|uniref:GntR family transcriptional regulator n=1 Tax=Neoroseomonas marina TaxID=1232220 RepID=A0A848EBD5_9PROT|nr:GntR family transcriptional regulator [Neoroseomonas marina]NMJ41452.1 GntR family transcriptional regulator [Neoroseomonas marina]
MATAWEQSYLTLRRRLADGTYPAGSRLREEELAAQLGVSRTPIREALRRLDAEGWLRVVPNQGAFAAEWSRQDIEEIFDLRALLEAHACEQAAMRPTATGVAALFAACEAGEACMPASTLAAMETVSDANVRFHQTIWEMSGQARTRSMLGTLAVPPMILRNFRHFDEANLRRSLAQHREMAAAIASRNPSLAGAVMRAHVEAGKAIFLAAAPQGTTGAAT